MTRYPAEAVPLPVRVLIVDDHDMVRLGVRTLLQAHPEWEVVGEASNGREALQQVIDLMPEVVILDLSMPDINGFDAAAAIRHAAPFIKIVLFSMHDIPTTARAVGADAFVAKSAGGKELVSTLTRLLDGTSPAYSAVPPAVV
jgi:DNA-binding NarL/FixJ family response regulator